MNDELYKEVVEALRELLDAEEWFRLMRSEKSARELTHARTEARATLRKVDATSDEEM